MDILNLIQQEDENTCSGKIYRCKINIFLNAKKEYVEQIRMIPQKRLSCQGCMYCGQINDELPDFINMKESLIPEEAVDGALYRLDIINGVADWEYDLGFIQIDEE